MWRVWGRIEVCTGCWWESQRERDHLEEPDIDGKTISRRIFRKWNWEIMDWIDLAQNRDRWRALVKAVRKSHFP
jgi:hypothetical protein